MEKIGHRLVAVDTEKFYGALIHLLEERQYGYDIIGQILTDVLMARSYATSEPDEEETLGDERQ